MTNPKLINKQNQLKNRQDLIDKRNQSQANYTAKNNKRFEMLSKLKNNSTKVKTGGMDPLKLASPKTKNFNVGVSKGGVSFGEAFKHFRNKGNKTFTWNGKKYTTELAKKKYGGGMKKGKK